MPRLFGDTILFALDANGQRVSGAELFVFIDGTSTPVVTFSDAQMQTIQSSPVVADGSGVFPPVYVTGQTPYAIAIRTPAGVDLPGSPILNVITNATGAPPEQTRVTLGIDMAGNAARLIPFGNTAGRPTPEANERAIYFDTDVGGLIAWDGTAWGEVAPDQGLQAHTHPWSEVTGKPTTFPPLYHTHPISEVAGLQGQLNAKQPLGAYAGYSTSGLAAERIWPVGQLLTVENDGAIRAMNVAVGIREASGNYSIGSADLPGTWRTRQRARNTDSHVLVQRVA